MSDNDNKTIRYLCNFVKSIPEGETWITEYVDISIYLKGTDNDYWKWIRNRMRLNRSIRRKSELYQRSGQDILLFSNLKCRLTLQLLDSNRFIIVFEDGYQMEGEVAEKAVTRYHVEELRDLYEESEKKTMFDEKCYRVLFTNDWLNDSKDIQYIYCPVTRVEKSVLHNMGELHAKSRHYRIF